MSEDKLEHMINFRSTEKMYKSLMEYLEMTGKTISSLMRQITFDYLLLKKDMKENGYGKSKPIKKKVEKKINAPPQAIMYCDSEHCEIDPRKLK